MPRTLHLDVTQGATSGSILAALIDIGVAPSPILHALGSLELPAHLIIADTGGGYDVRSDPGEAPFPARDAAPEVRRGPLPPTAAGVAARALEQLVESTRPKVEGPCLFQHMVDAGIVLTISAAAMAAQTLEPARITASRIPIDAEPTDALIDILGDVADALDFDSATPVTEDAAALLLALTQPDNLGRAEPTWRGVVSHGRSATSPKTRAQLGDTD